MKPPGSDLFLLLTLIILMACSKQENETEPILPKNPDKEKNTPNDYDTAGTQNYHTVYLLDANWYFNGSHWRIDSVGVCGIINQLVDKALMPDVILVGIGNVNQNNTSTRGRDFHSAATTSFYDFITEDLIPIIDARFHTDMDNQSGRTLIGHSSTGYFTMYAFYRYDTTTYNPFRNFITLSCDLNKPFQDLFEEEVHFYHRMGPLKEVDMTLFLGVGEMEEERFLTSYHTIMDSLSSRHYNDFRLDGKIYPDHDHGSYLVEAIMTASRLRKLPEFIKDRIVN